VVAALAERGIGLDGVAPKPITTELLANADLVITMGRHATGPTLPRPASAADALTQDQTASPATLWRAIPGRFSIGRC